MSCHVMVCLAFVCSVLLGVVVLFCVVYSVVLCSVGVWCVWCVGFGLFVFACGLYCCGWIVLVWLFAEFRLCIYWLVGVVLVLCGCVVFVSCCVVVFRIDSFGAFRVVLFCIGVLSCVVVV